MESKSLKQKRSHPEILFWGEARANYRRANFFVYSNDDKRI